MARSDDRGRYLEHAQDAWSHLEARSIGRRWFRFAVTEGGGSRASLWTLVHVMAAANDLAALGHDAGLARLVRLLPRYRAGHAYLASPGERLRYFDDNAWLGLLSLRIADRTGDDSHRRRAARIAEFLRLGEHPEGGIHWREAHESRNACSTAPTGELFLALGAADAVPVAERLVAWIEVALARSDGLIADRIEDGTLEPTVWSYNQGATIGLLRLLAEQADEVGSRTHAERLARASLGHFTPARIWTEPPPFVAIWFRELLALPDVADVARERLLAHVARLHADARDPATGFYTAGDVGSYDGRSTIDQAATVQLFALAAGAPAAPAGDA